MAKKTVVSEVLEDDLDGGPADRTIDFGWDGVAYQIELSKKNAAEFEKLLRPYVAVARRARASSRGRRSGGRSGRRDLQDIREWAAQHGHKVSSRGRIASTVVDAYDAAH